MTRTVRLVDAAGRRYEVAASSSSEALLATTGAALPAEAQELDLDAPTPLGIVRARVWVEAVGEPLGDGRHRAIHVRWLRFAGSSRPAVLGFLRQQLGLAGPLEAVVTSEGEGIAVRPLAGAP